MLSEDQPVPLFEWATRTSVKVRCKVCGRSGYGPLDPSKSGAERPAPWQQSCLMGHPFVCTCGRAFATAQAIAAHVRKTNEPGPHAMVRDE